MNAAVDAAALLFLLAVPAALWRGRRGVRGTTLQTAWWCAAAAAACWAAGFTCRALRIGPAAIHDQLWYAVAVFMLCPPVAILGARRPIARAWPWFVLLPMVIVLGLPLMTAWTRNLDPLPLELEGPPTVGYLLVLVMGAGNYFGTRFTLSAVLYAAALALVVLPMSTIAPASMPEAAALRPWATIVLGLSALAAVRSAAQPTLAPTSFDRIWIDFRDAFGIVWARRVQERLNQTAATEKWPVRVGMDGLVPVGEREVTDEDRAKIEHAFRWILRRFVDAEWIDARLRSQGDDTGD